MADDLLKLAERSLRAAEAVLSAGLQGGDPAQVLAAIRAVRDGLALVAELRPVSAEADVSFDAEIADLIVKITSQAGPVCGRCGSSCSECASELLPAMGSIDDLYRSKAALARDRAPGGPENEIEYAVVLEDVPDEPKALPAHSVPVAPSRAWVETTPPKPNGSHMRPWTGR